MPATPTTTAIAIGATVVRMPSKLVLVTEAGHHVGADGVEAKEETAARAGIARSFLDMIFSPIESFFLSPCGTVNQVNHNSHAPSCQHDNGRQLKSFPKTAFSDLL